MVTGSVTALPAGGNGHAWLTADRPEVRHIHTAPARAGHTVAWPGWVPAPVLDRLGTAGLTHAWRHQVEAADAAVEGRDVVVATPTASGKSLAYLVPVLAATAAGPASVAPQRQGPRNVRQRLISSRRPHTALYLAPTKALAHDQLRAARELAPSGWAAGALDGDSSPQERTWAREYATFLVSNPDMLHRSVLPQHQRWAGFLGSLRYVVIDEAHRYRGVFGAHMAAVVRRLRRLCRSYGADPVFIGCSATSSNPAESLAALTGTPAADVLAVTEDASPHGEVTTWLWDPDGSCDDASADLLARLVDDGAQTVAFVASRRMAEVVALRAAAQARAGAGIRAYRAGYLAEERRALERDLSRGVVRGVASTNALELGVDLTGLDAVVVSGFPGTLAALRQQAGRAGRRGRSATVVLVARHNPLDAYLFAHPDLLFGSPVERTVLHPDNPHVLGPHLCAAAQELPLTPADAELFGPSMVGLAERLTRQGALRRRAAGWFWTRPDRAVDSIDLRSQGGRPIQVVESATGRVLGTVDQAGADAAVHPGAVYLHQGETFLVDELSAPGTTEVDDDGAEEEPRFEALVRAERPGWFTQPITLSSVEVTRERGSRRLGLGTLHWGDVAVTSQVSGFYRRDEVTLEIWDSTPLELPVRTLATQSVWWTLPAGEADRLGLGAARLGAAAHAVEHCAIGLLPLFAPCDRWDIGGLSTMLHPDTGLCTVFVHDAHPGGAGFARAGFDLAEPWLTATAERLASCPCDDGCPACVVSPKCGNANSALDKAAAQELVTAWLS